MKYPKKFIMTELMKMTSEELSNLDDALYADWRRVRQALKVVISIEEEK